MDVSWQLVVQVVLLLSVVVVSIIVMTKASSVQKDASNVKTQGGAIQSQIQSAINTINEISKDAELLPSVQEKVNSAITTLSSVSSATTSHSTALGATSSSMRNLVNLRQPYAIFVHMPLSASDLSLKSPVGVSSRRQVTFTASNSFENFFILDETRIENLARNGYSICKCGWAISHSGTLEQMYPGGPSLAFWDSSCATGLTGKCSKTEADGIWLLTDAMTDTRASIQAKAEAMGADVTFFPLAFAMR